MVEATEYRTETRSGPAISGAWVYKNVFFKDIGRSRPGAISGRVAVFDIL
jgi:hypothetical protein